ncbi:TetR family transcriptional regulator C-terminal domain-containing protein [Actinoallomurus sp. NBC_01490]|uniref:TetR family transcriptional regulator C-terminal domain-containing protein n=1 Tax=Actinoallomurus sp. NBC_01490 TaxID=2903557 RepID=UPI002E360077|nr:TetR family transcriptional regulator C-terminal domain-containing protein [Actinoallomurus sp. NBC_01490]
MRSNKSSESQLYHYFSDRDALVRDIIALQVRMTMNREQKYLKRLDSLAGLRRWAKALMQLNSLQSGRYGCALGAMTSEYASRDEKARVILSQAFKDWEKLLADGFRRMQDGGTLSMEVDPETLATGLIATLQGGYLLAKAARDTGLMELALNMAIDHVESYRVGEPDTWLDSVGNLGIVGAPRKATGRRPTSYRGARCHVDFKYALDMELADPQNSRQSQAGNPYAAFTDATSERRPLDDACDLRRRYRTGSPVTVRPMTRRWISDVPSKMVKILLSRCQRSTG